MKAGMTENKLKLHGSQSIDVNTVIVSLKCWEAIYIVKVEYEMPFKTYNMHLNYLERLPLWLKSLNVY